MTTEMKKRMRMQDKVMKKYGFENEFTVWFCQICDQFAESEWNNKCIEIAYKALMQN